MICDVFWCHTTAEGAAAVWAACIGLLGGVLALIGAIMIGRRQMMILGEQTAIQARAMGIEDLKVRADLFDRRMDVYETVEAYVRAIQMRGQPPSSTLVDNGTDREEDLALSGAFHEAMNRSRFLFGDEVRQRIWDDIWRKASMLESHLIALEEAEGDVDHASRIADLQTHFALYDLDKLFANKLRLY